MGIIRRSTAGGTDPTQTFTQDDSQYIATDKIQARDSDGLELRDDSGTYGLLVENDGDVVVKLGDAAGTQKFIVTDSSDVEIANIDSDGLATVKRLQAESSIYPVLGFIRTTSLTGGDLDTINGIASAMRLRTKTSGDMTDGFGGGFLFEFEDDAGSSATGARLYARRDGADNQAALQLLTGGSGTTPTLTLRGDSEITHRIDLKGGVRRQIKILQTTDATTTDIFSISVAEGENVYVEARISARESGGGNRANYKLFGCFYRNSSGNVTQQGDTFIDEISSDETWDVDLIADTTAQTIDIRCTGKASTTVDWVAEITWLTSKT